MSDMTIKTDRNPRRLNAVSATAVVVAQVQLMTSEQAPSDSFCEPRSNILATDRGSGEDGRESLREHSARLRLQRRSGHRTRRLRGADPLMPRASGFTTLPTNAIPAALASSPTCTTASRTRSWRRAAIFVNLDHRGATGADATLGDGCGVLIQIPHRFFARNAPSSDSRCPSPATRDRSVLHAARRASARASEKIVEEAVVAEGQKVLGWRDVPSTIPASVRA